MQTGHTVMLFYPVLLTLTDDLDIQSWPRCTCRPKMNIQGQGIQHLVTTGHAHMLFCSCDIDLDW